MQPAFVKFAADVVSAKRRGKKCGAPPAPGLRALVVLLENGTEEIKS